MDGLTIGPLINYILEVDHSERLIMNASILTALVFGSFTLASLLTNKRSFIYLGGLLGSVLSLYSWMTFINIFLNSKTLYSVELYLGLLMFSGYVMYDTQLIIYRATYLKSFDVVSHTLDLFIDLVGIFVRILLILFKESGDNRSNSSNSRRRNTRERRRADYAGY
jgi:FtsH-binding integral membrane protein